MRTGEAFRDFDVGGVNLGVCSNGDDSEVCRDDVRLCDAGSEDMFVGGMWCDLSGVLNACGDGETGH